MTTRRTTRPAVQPVRVTTPHPLAWQTALTLAGGDPSRLEVRSARVVIVHNHPHRSTQRGKL
jgi:hypothetical protein